MEPLNDVRLRGRVSAAPEPRTLPSGDEITTLRVVIDRPPRPKEERRRVDVLDLVCWTGRTRAAAARLEAGDVVEVDGSLRRRFFRTGSGAASRYEVEVAKLRRLRRERPARPPG